MDHETFATATSDEPARLSAIEGAELQPAQTQTLVDESLTETGSLLEQPLRPEETVRTVSWGDSTGAKRTDGGDTSDTLFATDAARDLFALAPAEQSDPETESGTHGQAKAPSAPPSGTGGSRGSYRFSTRTGTERDRDGGASSMHRHDLLETRYRLVKRIGQGAYGEVWEADDLQLTRPVALKILKSRMCRPDLLLRFDLERQVLARMTHPNIAAVFDTGSLADGRPFLAMELIAGEPLSKFCDVEMLGLAARLTVFAQVCRAVHHAHERLILHRDLKPTNILAIRGEDGAPVAKVIDFGIAKILSDQENLPEEIVTLEGSLKGTPAYMSPEQTRERNPGLTARSDVFTLGVILYELLTGDTPITRKRYKELELLDLVDLIRHEEPAPPSAVTARAENLPELAEQRATTPLKLPRLLRGDLDLITGRALEKEPERRYPTALELAADVERYLADEPILARPASLAYRLGKLYRRHCALVSAAALVLLALVATAVVSTAAYFAVRSALARESAERRRATEARQIAETNKAEAERQRQTADAARGVAEVKKTEALTARNAAVTARHEAEDLINYMLYDLREQLEPIGRSRLLESVSAQAEQYFSRQPASTDDDDLERNRAVLWYNRGRILLSQDRKAEAAGDFRLGRAAMLKRATAAPQDATRQTDLATASYGLGLGLLSVGDEAGARAVFLERLPFLREAAGREKASADLVRLLAAYLEQLGDLTLAEGHAPEALTLYREQAGRLDSLRAVEPAKPVTVARAVADEKIGGALERLGLPKEALASFEHGLDRLRPLLETSFDDLPLRRSYIVLLEKRGNCLLELREPEKARASFEERLRESELLARIDPGQLEWQRDLAVARERLAFTLAQLRRFDEALALARQALTLAGSLAVKHADDPAWQREAAMSHCQVAAVVVQMPGGLGRVAEIREHAQAARAILARLPSTKPPDAAAQEKMEKLNEILANLDKAAPAK